MSIVQAIACDRCAATAASAPQVEMRKLGWARVQTGTDAQPSTVDLCPVCAVQYRALVGRWVAEHRQAVLPLGDDSEASHV